MKTLTTGAILGVGLVVWLSHSPHGGVLAADREEIQRPVLVYAEPAEGARLHYLDHGPLMAGVVLQLIPEADEDGTVAPPWSISYAMETKYPSGRDFLRRFPLLEKLPRDQQMSALVFVDVAPGRYNAFALLPGHAMPVATEFLRIVPESAHKLVVPPFVPVRLTAGGSDVLDKIVKGIDWMIVAHIDEDPANDVTSDCATIDGIGTVEFWALTSRRHRSWLVPNTTPTIDRPMKGYELKSWSVPEKTLPESLIRLEPLSPKPELEDIPTKEDDPEIAAPRSRNE